jgi:biopolymer transport protein ExbD
MLDFESEKKRPKVIALQLAPMIDVFVLIIVFLLKGTILEETAVQKPEGLNLARSLSSEKSEVAPQVIVTRDYVDFKMVNMTKPISDFQEDQFDPRDPLLAAFKNFQDQKKGVEGAQHVNLISDRSISYKVIYHVIKVLRISGFQFMLFVAEGESP